VRDIQLCLAESDPARYKTVVECWENIRNVYSSHLGKSLVIDEISKLCVFLGLHQGANYEPPVEGVANLYRSDFELSGYLELSPRDQDLSALEYVESSLVWLAGRHGVPTDSIRLAATRTVESDFRYEFELKRTSRTHARKKLKAKLFICFRRGGGGTAVEARVFDAKGNLLGVETIVRDEWFSRRWLASYWVTCWQGTTFVAENHGPGMISFRSQDYGG
jgi:hypothetical protein